jgi:acyl dehydratase
MAIINVAYDTKSKQLDVDVNGERLKNVNHVSVWRSHDEADNQNFVEVSVETAEVNVDEELAKRVVFFSAGSNEAEKAIADGSAITSDKLPGLVGIAEVDPVDEEINQFLRGKLGY